MGKDTEVDDDILDENTEQPVVEKEQQDEAPKDIRGALRAAIKEQSEGAEDDRADERNLAANKKDKKSAKLDNSSGGAKKSAAENSESDLPKQEKEGSEKQVSSSEGKEEKKLAPPPGWTKEGKALWEKLPPDAQTSVLKREKEFSDGITQYAQKARAYDEFDRVIAPYRQQIDQFGVSPAQTVDRLFQWMAALSNQDAGYKLNAFKALAANFGVNVAQLVPQQLDGNQPNEQDLNNPPQWFQQHAAQTQQQIQSLTESNQRQKEEAAQRVIGNWASDKPHYQKVRNVMHGLLATGIVPLKNGEVDLDEAYKQAVKLDPEISAQVEQEAIQKAAADKAEKAKQEAQLAAARAAKAKQAGSSLKPSAPGLNASSIKGKPNGTGKKSTSVRDSLIQSIGEVRDS